MTVSQSWGSFKSFIEEGGCPVVPRRSNTCDSTDAVCTGDISELRKMGHEGVISHQIRRTCPQFCHVYSVSVIKVIDSGRNSQGLRSAQNSLYGFCPSESAASSLWWTLSNVERQREWQGGDLHTCTYLFKTL